MATEDSTLRQNPNADQITLQQILQIVTETKEEVGKLNNRVLAVKVQMDNLNSVGYKAISVANEALSIVHGLRGEIRALRAESAFQNRELNRLEKQLAS